MSLLPNLSTFGKNQRRCKLFFRMFPEFLFFSGYLNTPQKKIDPLMCSAYLTEGFSILTPCQRNNPLEINSNSPLENTVGKYTHQYSPMYFVLLKTWKLTKFYIIKFKFNNAYLLNLFKYRYYFTVVERTSIYEQCKELNRPNLVGYKSCIVFDICNVQTMMLFCYRILSWGKIFHYEWLLC